ncbi:hypothetical protein J437_LFUL001039 [Ladona fulva]|uniref:PiggyBac transposable element-derived protein domain-containing protein n=1 Tax=Ladona fulva TaxID=123851 RepID=A0A8K0P644_LADFU|nr:hypothetical protein J437_LFUL001039 [Ladona fulva]
MGGVDKCDQMLTVYPTERKMMKIWYKKTFRHLINMCTFNAHVLHQKLGGKMDALEFREDLIQNIIVKYHPGIEYAAVKRGRKSAEENPLRIVERHFPEYVPATAKKTNATRRCEAIEYAVFFCCDDQSRRQYALSYHAVRPLTLFYKLGAAVSPAADSHQSSPLEVDLVNPPIALIALFCNINILFRRDYDSKESFPVEVIHFKATDDMDNYGEMWLRQRWRPGGHESVAQRALASSDPSLQSSSPSQRHNELMHSSLLQAKSPGGQGDTDVLLPRLS